MKKSIIPISLLIFLNPAGAHSFTPSQEPLLKLNRPKNNVFVMFDDSASIATTDIYVSEHFIGFGLPVCTKPSNWNQIVNSPQYKNGNYYNPFATGTYIPYNPNTQHFNYDGAIYLEQCAEINRSEAFKVVLEQFLSKFNKEYFIGFGGLGENNTATLSWYENYKKEYPLIINEVEDLSQKTASQWQEIHKKIETIFLPSNVIDSWSPIFPAIYNISLYFRGYPLPKSSNGMAQGYNYQEFQTPLKYRCAKNNLMLFTDGKANRSFIDVFAKSDVYSNSTLRFGSNLKEAQTKEFDTNANLVIRHVYPTLLAQDLMDTNYYDYTTSLGYVEDGYTGSEDGIIYDELQYYLDPNRYSKASYKIPAYVFQGLLSQNLLDSYSHNKPSRDKVGKSWDDDYSIPQTLTVNAIVFSDKPTPEFTGLISATHGKYMMQDSIDLSSTFENTQKLFEGSNSFTYYTNGFSIEDQYMRTEDTIRYAFYYNYYTNSGSIKAYTLKNKIDWNSTAEWTTNQKTYPLDGKFVTMTYNSSTSTTPDNLSMNAISTVFKSAYSINQLNINYINWLRGISETNTDAYIKFKPRISPIGPIINAKPEFFSRDKEYINLSLVSDLYKQAFENYILYKAKYMNSEFLITGANDGLVHFINTARKNELANNKGGQRKAAYFPGFLAARLLHITQLDKPFTFTMDGQTNIFEFKGRDGNFRSVGITGMGAGGKGIVGYQLFKMIGNGRAAEQDIKPLFEIVNEDKFAFNTPNFENLGYTYSGFEFFNQGIPNKDAGIGVAAFGNGYDNKASSVYLIDVENGKLLKEVLLSYDGGGASTPALFLSNNTETGLQQLRYLVVGDQAGRLYKVNFSGDDITTSNHNVEVLYQPETLFEQPISTRPMLYTPENGSTWAYFGTGRKADENSDRGSKSKIQQYFIGFPINVKPNFKDLYEIKYSVQSNNIIKLANEDKNESNNSDQVKSGWYLKLTPSNQKLNGNRLVYQPGMTAYGDIVFSTWQLDEGSDSDLCIEDTGSGFQFALDADTAQKGLFTSNGKNVSGIKVNGTAPGIPSGTSISYLGNLTGALDHGAISTMSQETIAELNKLHKQTSHAESSQHLTQCLATTNGETDIQMPEFCHDIQAKVLNKGRVSFQILHSF